MSPVKISSGEESEMCNYNENNTVSVPTSKNISYISLINWNISKVTQKNPNINLLDALVDMNEKLKSASFDKRGGEPHSEERYLTCALLAWQNLGQTDPSRLYQLVTQNKIDHGREEREVASDLISNDRYVEHRNPNISPMTESCSVFGPVVKLPVQSAVVMRVDNPSCCGNRPRPSPNRATQKNAKEKNDTNCCAETNCSERLTTLDQSTNQLRRRAGQLAKREAERVELLERAEAAWRDLETGYQRRLKLAEEKENTMNKQIQKLIEERNGYKNACIPLAQELREKGDNAEDERKKLADIEKQLCDRACVRHRLAEEAARGDSCLADQQCKAAQLDRDLQFKEEQAQRKLVLALNNLESMKMLGHESERVLRADMSELQEQAKIVSQQLLDEEANISALKDELDELKKLKDLMLKDLDGCQMTCDARMQKGLDELKKKKAELNKLKERVLECRCKLPLDASVQVKRTPSLAALCTCRPDDRICEPCSCTSLRTNMLTNLFSDLFRGLQSELGRGITMPCQLLKCLEDRHDWDQATTVKTRLREYFSKLLLGELDIAIATAIEKYHARWVGATCADKGRLMAEKLETENELCEAHQRIQQRDIEFHAQELATKLADQIFKEKAETLAAARAKEILAAGPPPCECAKQNNNAQVLSCLLQPKPQIRKNSPVRKPNDVMESYWLKTHNNVNQLRSEIEDLKKESNKKKDLKTLEKKLSKIVQKATNTEPIPNESKQVDNVGEFNEEIINHHNFTSKTVYFNQHTNKKLKSKIVDIQTNDKKIKRTMQPRNFAMTKVTKDQKKSNLGQTLAVNVCMCGNEKSQSNNKQQKNSLPLSLKTSSKPWKRNALPLAEVTSIKRSKPIATMPSPDIYCEDQNSSLLLSMNHSCEEECICFNKPPSTTSIKKLINNLIKWQSDYSCTHNTVNKNTMYESQRSMSQNADCKQDIKEKNESLISMENNNTHSDHAKTTTTESEYIGTVNLENKSSEYVPNPDNKCLSKEKCEYFKTDLDSHCDKELPITPVNDNFKEEMAVNNENVRKSVIKNISKHITEFKNETKIVASNDVTEIRENHISKKHEYMVKLLGVTLVDRPPLPNKSVSSVKKYQGELNKSKAKAANKYPPSTIAKDVDKEVNNASIKLHSDRNNMNVVLDNDTQTATGVTDQTSECVCCNKATVELEENAFQLLREHFRVKLEDFRKSSCKSNCLENDIAHNLLSSMFTNVKLLISNDINKISCKCPNELNVENSWNRTYSLLQEYLKIKIKRAHCHCSDKSKFSMENNGDNFQKDMLTKICKLIESDFDRIKYLCSCHIKTDLIARNKNESNNDNVVQDNLICEKPKETSDKLSFTKNVMSYFNNEVLKKDVSTRQSKELSVENKSCAAIEHNFKDIQTYDKDGQEFGANLSKYPFNSGLKNRNAIITCRNLSSSIKPNVSYPIISLENDSNRNDILVVGNINYEQIGSAFHKFENTAIIPECSKLNSARPISGDKDIFNFKHDIHTIEHSHVGCTIDSSRNGSLEPSKLSRDLVNPDNHVNVAHMNDILVQHEPLPCDNYYNMINTNVNNEKKEINVKTIKECPPESEQKRPTNNNDKKCKGVNVNNIEDMVLKDTSNAALNNKHVNSNTYQNSVDTQISTYFSANNNYFKQETYNASQYLKNKDIILHNKCNSKDVFNSTLNKEDNTHASASDIKNKECDCRTVPLCHIKMLVENMEKALLDKQCTCCISTKVCPIHGIKN